MKIITRERLAAVPLLGNLLRVGHQLLKLPDTYDAQTKTNSSLLQATNEIREVLNKLNDRLDEHTEYEQSYGKRLDSLSQQILLANSVLVKDTNKESDEGLFADDHLLDRFYTAFEDRFRGTEEMINTRLKEHLALLKKSEIDFKKFPIIDIGSGRGEFLKLLNENKIPAEGLDINIDMVHRSQKAGLKATQGDALSFLLKQKPQTYGAITGFHIVEHIPFSQLYRIFLAAHAALTNGGFVLFETPNPENTVVGSCTFYLDPSHLKPIPPELLAFTLETCGFTKTEILRLHPVPKKERLDSNIQLPPELEDRFFGPRDYAVVAYK